MSRRIWGKREIERRSVQSEAPKEEVTVRFNGTETLSPLLPVPSNHAETQKSATISNVCEEAHINNPEPHDLCPELGFDAIPEKNTSTLPAVATFPAHCELFLTDDKRGTLFQNCPSLKIFDADSFDSLILIGDEIVLISAIHFDIGNYTRIEENGLGIFLENPSIFSDGLQLDGILALESSSRNYDDNFHENCSYGMTENSVVKLDEISNQKGRHIPSIWVEVATVFRGGGNVTLSVVACEIKVHISWTKKATGFKGGTVIVLRWFMGFSVNSTVDYDDEGDNLAKDIACYIGYEVWTRYTGHTVLENKLVTAPHVALANLMHKFHPLGCTSLKNLALRMLIPVRTCILGTGEENEGCCIYCQQCQYKADQNFCCVSILEGKHVFRRNICHEYRVNSSNWQG